MFRFIRTKMTIKRVAFYSLSVPLCVAVYQGHKMRTKWLETGKLEPPTGQLSGIENWKSTIKTIQDRFHDVTHTNTNKNNPNDKASNDNANNNKSSTDEENSQIITNIEKIFASIRQKILRNTDNEKDQTILVNKVKAWMENMYSILDQQMHVHSSTSSSSKPTIYVASSSASPSSSSSSSSSSQQQQQQKQRPRKIKLLIIGDSLAAGVGCSEREQTPVLVKTLSKILSVTLGVDIEWKVAGIVGGTVNDLRTNLLPTIKSDFLTISSSELELYDVQIIAVIICGLNDWRTMLENFPFGSGPETFKKDLLRLITDLKSDLPKSIKCRIFLPSTPLSIALTDPTSLFTQQPVASLIGFLNNRWDSQKHHLACDCEFSSSSSSLSSFSSDPLELPAISCITMDSSPYNDYTEKNTNISAAKNRNTTKLIKSVDINKIEINTTTNTTTGTDETSNSNNETNTTDNNNISSNSNNNACISTTRYIDSPDVSSLYATPGVGTISIDGVHPSNQGYNWWALHIAEAILASELECLD